MPPKSSSQDQLVLFESIREVAREAIKEAASAPRQASDSRLALTSYPQLMRLDQVAAFLNCNEEHIRNLVDEGHLESVPINPGSTRRHLRVKRASVEALVNQAQKSQL